MTISQTALAIVQDEGSTDTDIIIPESAEAKTTEFTDGALKTRIMIIIGATLEFKGLLNMEQSINDALTIALNADSPAEGKLTFSGEANISAAKLGIVDGVQQYARAFQILLATATTVPKQIAQVNLRFGPNSKTVLAGLNFISGGVGLSENGSELAFKGGSLQTQIPGAAFLGKGKISFTEGFSTNWAFILSGEVEEINGFISNAPFVINNRVGGGTDKIIPMRNFFMTGGNQFQTFGSPRVRIYNGYDTDIRNIPHLIVEVGGGIVVLCEINVTVKDINGNPIEGVSVAAMGEPPENTPDDLMYYDRTLLAPAVDIAGLNVPENPFEKTNALGKASLVMISKVVTTDEVLGANKVLYFTNDKVNGTFNVFLKDYDVQDSVSIVSARNITPTEVEVIMVPDTSVTKSEANLALLDKLETVDDLYDFYTQLKASDKTTSFAEGYDIPLMTVQDSVLTMLAGWGLVFNSNTNAIPLAVDTALKVLTVYTGGTFSEGPRYGKVVSDKDIVHAGTDVNAILQYVRNGTTFSTLKVSTQVHADLEGHSYNVEIAGDATQLLQQDYIDNQDIYVILARTLYANISLHISGPNVIDVEDSNTSALFPEVTVLGLSNAQVIQTTWESRFLADTAAASVTENIITIIGDWSSTSGEHLRWVIERAVADLKKTVPSVREEDYVTFIGNVLTLKKPLTDASNIKITSGLLIDAEGKIVFDEANQDFLTQDFGVTAEAGDFSTIRLSALEVGDMYFYETGGLTQSALVTEAGAVILVVNKAAVYRARVDRLGLNSPVKQNITAGAAVTFDFFEIANLEYTGASGLSVTEKIRFDSVNNIVEVLEDITTGAVTPAEIAEAKETFINFGFEINRAMITALGIDALPFFSKIDLGKITLNYQMKSAKEYASLDEYNTFKDSLGNIAEVGSISGNEIFLKNPSATDNIQIRENDLVQFVRNDVIIRETRATTEQIIGYPLVTSTEDSAIITGHQGENIIVVDPGLPIDISLLINKFISTDGVNPRYKISHTQSGSDYKLTITHLDGSVVTDGIAQLPTTTLVHFHDPVRNFFRVLDVTDVADNDEIHYTCSALVQVARKVAFYLIFNLENSDPYLVALPQDTVNAIVDGGFKESDKVTAEATLAAAQAAQTKVDSISLSDDGKVNLSKLSTIGILQGE